MGVVVSIKEYLAEKQANAWMGVNREEMPQVQVDVANLSRLSHFCGVRGIGIGVREIDPIDLKPTQSDIDPEKALDMPLAKFGKNLAKNPLIVSKDMFILDGHHRWYLFKEKIGARSVFCIVIDRPVRDALRLLSDFCENDE